MSRMGKGAYLSRLGFSIRFHLKYHLSLITSVTLGKLLIIGLAVPKFPYLKMGIHSLFNKYWLGTYSIPGTVLDTRDAAINKKAKVPALMEFPFYQGETKLTGRIIYIKIKIDCEYKMPSTLSGTQ